MILQPNLYILGQKLSPQFKVCTRSKNHLKFHVSTLNILTWTDKGIECVLNKL